MGTDCFGTAVLLEQVLFLCHHFHQQVRGVGDLYIFYQSVLCQDAVDDCHAVLQVFRFLKLLPDGFGQVVRQHLWSFGIVYLFTYTNQVFRFGSAYLPLHSLIDDVFVYPLLQHNNRIYRLKIQNIMI